MKNKKILIIEDEQIIAENLRLILNEFGYPHVNVAIDVEEALLQFKKTAYQLVLMDINLGESSAMDGIDLIKVLKKKYTFVFLYVTANADEKTVQKAKVTQPAGYILKPFAKPSIYANVEIALNSIKEEQFFTYSNKGMQYQLAFSQITHIESDGSYSTIFDIEGKQYFVRKSLAQIFALNSSNFIRIHKSVLINKEHIQSYSSQTVQINDLKLPLGRAYKVQFIEQIKELPIS